MASSTCSLTFSYTSAQAARSEASTSAVDTGGWKRKYMRAGPRGDGTARGKRKSSVTFAHLRADGMDAAALAPPRKGRGSSLSRKISNESAAPTAPKGIIVALNLAATRANSAVPLGQNSLCASFLPWFDSRTPPGKSSAASFFCISLTKLRGVTWTAPNFSKKVLSCVALPPRTSAASFHHAAFARRSDALFRGAEDVSASMAFVATGCARPRMSVSRSAMNWSTSRGRSKPKSWWLPTRSTGPPVSLGKSTAPKPRSMGESALLRERKTGETSLRSGSTTPLRVSASSAAVGGTKSSTDDCAFFAFFARFSAP
mmetsp:Transcript_11617/g.41011  ORF Transcript_11617/g.41011 Transcript_11617/m.41011 type:complete len:315 (+) Transcript_11617:85-1029(+)